MAIILESKSSTPNPWCMVQDVQQPTRGWIMSSSSHPGLFTLVAAGTLICPSMMHGTVACLCCSRRSLGRTSATSVSWSAWWLMSCSTTLREGNIYDPMCPLMYTVCWSFCSVHFYSQGCTLSQELSKNEYGVHGCTQILYKKHEVSTLVYIVNWNQLTKLFFLWHKELNTCPHKWKRLIPPLDHRHIDIFLILWHIFTSALLASSVFTCVHILHIK